MVKVVFTALGLALLCGCETAPVAQVDPMEMQRRQAAAQAFQAGLSQQMANNTALLQTTQPQAYQAPRRTTCYPIGDYVNCTSY